MIKKFSLIFSLTVGAFVLTLGMFVVVVMSHEETPVVESFPGDGVIAPVQQEAALDHPGAKIFQANCKQCHRINQKLVGPALSGVFERYDSVWVTKWIRNSSKMIAEGDPIAMALFKEYNQIQMTSFTTLTDKEMKDLLEYLRLASDVKIAVPAPAPGGKGEV